jgi:alkanesulfonate monooxygenase SsuD/methylene tetrahydromethanopterin reductase-like flavin-dependent oxidoreductase (luciferase family)
MLRLTARWADAWNTAWYGWPTERFAAERDRLHAACDAEGRDPSTVDITVGVDLGGADRPGRVELNPEAIADALAAWDAEGVAHVICTADPTTAETAGFLFAGLDRYRAGR